MRAARAARATRARREGVVGDGGDGRWGGRGASGARAARGRGHRRGASVVRALVIQTTKRKRRGEEEKRKKKRVERRTERRGRREEAKRKKSAARGRGRATAATGGAVRAARARREGVVTVGSRRAHHIGTPSPQRTPGLSARRRAAGGTRARRGWGLGSVGVRVPLGLGCVGGESAPRDARARRTLRGVPPRVAG